MRNRNGYWMVLAAALMIGMTGCRGESPAEKPAPPAPRTAGSAEGAEKAATTAPEPEPEPPPPPPTIPEVLLPEALDKTCVVRVGDAMPDGYLADFVGKKRKLSEVLAKRPAVVFFFTAGDSELSALVAQRALEDLEKDVHQPYADKGLQVVAVNEGDSAEVVRRLAQQAGASFPVLLDPRRALFTKVARERLPRPYLLDADGKIRWFDLEFSQISSDKLLQGIQVLLGETAEKPGATAEPAKPEAAGKAAPKTSPKG